MTRAIARLPFAAMAEVYTVAPQLLGGNLTNFATGISRISISRARARIPAPRLPQ
jgi:hypothetical protein